MGPTLTPITAISFYAFHPMYADIKQMGTLKDKEAHRNSTKSKKN
jgi:4-alpha-glucanotransferase